MAETKRRTGPRADRVVQSAAKQQFAKNLRSLLIARNMTQSDLARLAGDHLPKGATFGRDLISNYVLGRNFASDMHLNAMCKVLKVKPEDLDPSRGEGFGVGEPPTDVRDMGNGRIWLRVNQSTTWEVGLKVLQLLKGEE